MIHVSASALIQVRVGDFYALLLNKAQLRERRRVLSPIGGAIQLDLNDGKELVAAISPQFEPDREPYELRFMLEDETGLEYVRKGMEKWGEPDAHRELLEKLCDETKIFSRDALNETYTLTRMIGEKPYVERVTHEGKSRLRVHRLAAVYRLTFNDDLRGKAAERQLRARGNLWLKQVTTHEILSGRSRSGEGIPGIAQAILDPVGVPR